MAQTQQWQPRGPPPDRGQNFFHFPRFQANEHLHYRHHFGGQHHRLHHRNKPFVFHNRNHEPMDRDRVLRQSFRDNFRDLATGGGRYHHRQQKGEGAHEEANIVELPGGINAKQMKKPSQRKTVDYNSSVVNYLENRVWQRDGRDRRAFNPDKLHHLGLIPPQAMLDNPMNAVATRHIRTSVNKNKCPIFSLAWTPEGRRLVTGAHSGEFVLWNGLTFNFETILQAHDTSVRTMKWSHNDLWMITADHNGFIKYWQSNMNNVKMYQAHKESIRALSFCPSDTKFASCSDDGTVRIWDFARCTEERILRGHGADVKCVDWHPQKSIVISGSKDAQQPIKLWDPRTGVALTTLHAHKNTCMDVKWGMNGHLFLTASRDHLIKLFDVRNMKEDVFTYKGHKKEVTNVAWNPIHESLFASAGSDGSIMFWTTNGEKEVGCMHQAHDGLIWSLSWHPVGHILASGSNDHCVKFWGRNRLGDTMRDRYNLNLNPTGMGEDEYYDETAADGVSLIPGMGIEQAVSQEDTATRSDDVIPGFDWTDEDLKVMAMERRRDGHVYYKSKALKHITRRVPETFERAWESGEQTVVTPRMEAHNRAMSDQRHSDNRGVNVEDLMGAPIMQQSAQSSVHNNNSPMLKLSSLNIEMEMAQIAQMSAMPIGPPVNPAPPPASMDGLPGLPGLGGIVMPHIPDFVSGAPRIPPAAMSRESTRLNNSGGNILPGNRDEELDLSIEGPNQMDRRISDGANAGIHGNNAVSERLEDNPNHPPMGDEFRSPSNEGRLPPVTPPFDPRGQPGGRSFNDPRLDQPHDVERNYDDTSPGQFGSNYGQQRPANRFDEFLDRTRFDAENSGANQERMDSSTSNNEHFLRGSSNKDYENHGMEEPWEDHKNEAYNRKLRSDRSDRSDRTDRTDRTDRSDRSARRTPRKRGRGRGRGRGGQGR